MFTEALSSSAAPNDYVIVNWKDVEGKAVA
jgi:hypothetical protein